MTVDRRIQQDNEADKQERAEFWERIYVPVNPTYAEDGSAPANPVTVADRFIEAGSIAVRTAAEAESLAEKVARLEDRINTTRKRILAKYFTEIKASWNADVLEAFILFKATEDEVSALNEWGTDLHAAKIRLDTLTKRLRTQVAINEWNKQYVDYDKYQGRLQPGRR